MDPFTKVASLAEVQPGNCKAVEAGGKTIALYNVDGKIYATSNTCLHRGGPLAEGMLDGAIVTCPWHGWQWNVTSGQNALNPAAAIATYEVKVSGEDIEVAVPL